MSELAALAWFLAFGIIGYILGYTSRDAKQLYRRAQVAETSETDPREDTNE